MRIPLDLGLSREQRLAELGRDLVNAACLHGGFVLSSGVESTFYFDKYLFETKPGILRRTANLLAELVPSEADRLAGSELGGVPLATAVALETGLPFLILRKPGDAHHLPRAVEGELYAGERVVLLEDVLATGQQAVRAGQLLKSAGADTLLALGVVDRQQGATERLASIGLQLKTLFRLSELGM
ncbi:MAG TPA: orotate phosphoribosyltransferase [Actinomycetes bacterium]|jgi:orotate phosphoribosyltransferase|nr:orotate phosphoribosyltransferase [Actinomycetes bacterium]